VSLLCGWVPVDGTAETCSVAASMGRALRTHPDQAWSEWSLPGLSVGLLEVTTVNPQDLHKPAVTPDGRYHLWMVGEVFGSTGLIGVAEPGDTSTIAFRQTLLGSLLKYGAKTIAHLDGEYLIVLWDGRERILTLLNDRFAGAPLYWARSGAGFAFASGVRGVLMAPGVPTDFDPEAIREAVTFGGFRLGDRTNVAAVKMVPGASMITVRKASPSFSRYWKWGDIPTQPRRALRELIEQAHHLWQQTIRQRLRASVQPGQTLSGGLDSRAILAEAARLAPRWTAITYGVPRCDDARYAQRAAEAMGATWVFNPLYKGRNSHWLDDRTSYIQQTDGLIQLVDLMHLESMPLQAQLLDLHVSGYGGDAICGTTYDEIRDAESYLANMPFYGTPIGWSWSRALDWAKEVIRKLDGAPMRLAVFDHKYPQAIHRNYQAPTMRLTVRKPFTAYPVFDFFEGVDESARSQHLYERMLRTHYPECFANIPNQKTGLPILSPGWLLQIERMRRLAWRQLQPRLARLSPYIRPRIRYYHADEIFWRVPDARTRIEGTILRPSSLVCEILGRAAVSQLVSSWFDRLAAPTQVIGALYVYEAYHRDLAAHLRLARAP
jgi:asparagine synthase (glutamine-hydrolysing)